VKFDINGNLHGATSRGGQSGASFGGYGTVFELARSTQAGGSWTETALYNFQNTGDGAGPIAAPVRDKSGNLFGTAGGVVYELSPPATAGGAWTEATLHSFAGTVGLGLSYAGLTFSSGHVLLYGTTQGGGVCNTHYCDGLAFAVHP
jgi:hypothetical protein